MRLSTALCYVVNILVELGTIQQWDACTGLRDVVNGAYPVAMKRHALKANVYFACNQTVTHTSTPFLWTPCMFCYHLKVHIWYLKTETESAQTLEYMHYMKLQFQKGLFFFSSLSFKPYHLCLYSLFHYLCKIYFIELET